MNIITEESRPTKRNLISSIIHLSNFASLSMEHKHNTHPTGPKAEPHSYCTVASLLYAHTYMHNGIADGFFGQEAHQALQYPGPEALPFPSPSPPPSPYDSPGGDKHKPNLGHGYM